MAVKYKKYGFTLIELLTVLAIISFLVGLLMPALTLVRNAAKSARQRAQLTTIDSALMVFRNDQGYYPPSDWQGTLTDYSGGQMLAEALLGWDLLGFHPKSIWDSVGTAYKQEGQQYVLQQNLKERVGPYLELGTVSAFKLGTVETNPGLFNDPVNLAPDTYVLCDVFGVRRLKVGQGKTVTAGSPILYYKATPSWKNISTTYNINQRIYNAYDNFAHISLGAVTIDGKRGRDHPLGDDVESLYLFDDEGGIRDRKIVAKPWPHRPDSYILITAGPDGLYGTRDDIRNF